MEMDHLKSWAPGYLDVRAQRRPSVELSVVEALLPASPRFVWGPRLFIISHSPFYFSLVTGESSSIGKLGARTLAWVGQLVVELARDSALRS